MKSVYFVRHGQTEGNTGLIFQGIDTPLTEVGVAQSHVVADQCTRLNVESFISSSARRAVQTAEIIQTHLGMSFETSDLFTERRRPSSLMDRSTSDEDARALEAEWTASTTTSGLRVLDGENFDDLKRRATFAFEFLRNHEASRILVVTHGFFLKHLLSHMIFGSSLTAGEFQKVLNAFRSENAGITTFTCDQTPETRETAPWRLLTWNDHTHLG